MASSSPNNLTSLLLILLTFLCIQIHARESHFFSKVPNNNVDNFDTKETSHVANKVAVEPLTTPQDQQQQPNFIPQSQDNGYGLYGHESGQLPPNSDNKFSDPTTYNNDNNYKRNGADSYKSEPQEYYNNDDDNNNYQRNGAGPYKSESQEYNDDDNNNYQRNGAGPHKSESQEYYKNNDDDNFQNGNSRKPYENSFYYNKDLYDNHRSRQSFHNTRLSRVDDFTTTPLYDQEKYDNNNNGRGNANNNVVRHGMSDTRFMENGKYYYDLNREPRHYSTSRGNFGNNNNGNAFEYGNSMGRFQNDEAEFQEEPDEFVP